jgi:hypothetical protein
LGRQEKLGHSGMGHNEKKIKYFDGKDEWNEDFRF